MTYELLCAPRSWEVTCSMAKRFSISTIGAERMGIEQVLVVVSGGGCVFYVLLRLEQLLEHKYRNIAETSC